MSPSTSRFILSGAVIGLARVSYSMGKNLPIDIMSSFYKYLPESMWLEYLEPAILACAVLGIGWLLVWWRQVRWTATRITLTIASSIGCIIPAVCFAMIMNRDFWPESSAYVAAICWGSCWIGSTALIWRSPEHSAMNQTLTLSRAVPCPQCGFDLQGQRNTQCPECGRAYCLGDFAVESADVSRSPA
jgi:hypothetical protein